MEKELQKTNKEIKFQTSGEKLAGILLDTIEQHQKYMRYVRMGGDSIEQLEGMDDDTRHHIQVRSLNRVISFQRELITHARPMISYLCFEDYKKSYKSKEEQSLHPFDKEENDYNSLLQILYFLKKAEQEILKADLTRTKLDDFIIWRTDSEGNKLSYLTNNFYDMVEDLEDSFEEIYKIMLKHGLLTTIITEQEKKLKSNEIF